MGARTRALAFALGLCSMLACASPAANAGQSCEIKPVTPKALVDALRTGSMAAGVLDRTGARVAIIARQGQDLSKYGLKYSHAGIAYKEAEGKPWRVVELLNQCGSAASDLWVDGLANFFLDDPFTLDFVVLAPPEAEREALARLAADPARLRALHTPRYSMLAYPYSAAYQNSNQWVLEVLAAAGASDGAPSRDARGLPTRAASQAWLRSAGYEPTELHLGPLTRLGGRMFKANVAFDDHPNALRFSDRIQTATVESIIGFVKDRREGWHGLEVAGPR